MSTAENKPLAFLEIGGVAIRISNHEERRVFKKWFRDPRVAWSMKVDEPYVNPEMEKRLYQEIDMLPPLVDDELQSPKTELALQTPEKKKRRRDRVMDITFAILELPGFALKGAIQLSQVSWIHALAHVRTIIPPGYQSGGLCAKAKTLVLRYGFESLKLDKISSYVLANNIPSFLCNKACGFNVEARLQREFQQENNRIDLLCMSIFAEDWPDAKRLFKERLNRKTVRRSPHS